MSGRSKILIFHRFFKVLGVGGVENIDFSLVFKGFAGGGEPGGGAGRSKIQIFLWFFMVFGTWEFENIDFLLVL